jgi:hypothetical protein
MTGSWCSICHSEGGHGGAHRRHALDIVSHCMVTTGPAVPGRGKDRGTRLGRRPIRDIEGVLDSP